MKIPLLGFSVELECLRRVINDVGRDAGYEGLTINQADAIPRFYMERTCLSRCRQAVGNVSASRSSRM